MADPLSLVALGAAVGGAAGKFVEKAWDAGEKWIGTYFENHHDKAVEKAKLNAAEFLNELASRVKILEETHAVKADVIATAQEHPDFSVALQKALLSAAQTESSEKHQLLARLIADRLQAPLEGVLALAGKMACDSIAFATANQLRILALQSALVYLKPGQELSSEAYLAWAIKHVGPYEHLVVGAQDFVHLEALSCIKVESLIGRSLEEIIVRKNTEKLDTETFFRAPLGSSIGNLWTEKNLQQVILTSVGQIISIYVSDMLTGTTTRFEGWQ